MFITPTFIDFMYSYNTMALTNSTQCCTDSSIRRQPSTVPSTYCTAATSAVRKLEGIRDAITEF